MSEHVSECIITRQGNFDAIVCICDRLRAAEQRGYEMHTAVDAAGHFADGVKAARDAVEAQPWTNVRRTMIGKEAALVAIDGIDKGTGGMTQLLCHYCQQPVGVGLHGHVDGTPLCAKEKP
jgi:hypothetical protein